ncbi:MAG: peptide-methionine (R)-S-oxide reductase MsrB [Pseudomonadota bacterium]
MTRRQWLGLLSLLGLGAGATAATQAAAPADAKPAKPAAPRIEPLLLSDAQWRQRLTPAQYHVLREEGTERAGTSPLNAEKRSGTYQCAGCDLALFSSRMKFESGTGWPSFFTSLPGTLQTKTDRLLGMARTEYHCARCGGHHGHVFDDGPKPTGLRYCNNGVALKFVAEAA